ncbi:hypothetical protein O3P69_019516 [Scylla paramamosain]|uniref:Uncharacterized protein n=1 Tax=Scylla paramamosain TaxID=85552 RepID=A0AAW0SW22_SCYPA
MEVGFSNCLPVFLLVLTACQEVTSQRFWTFQRPECVISADPTKHPVVRGNVNWINLLNVHGMSSIFYLAFRGHTFHKEGDCEIKQRHLYKVTKFNATSFAFDPLSQQDTKIVCSKNFGLQDKAFGFISCAKDEEEAHKAAEVWLDSLPFPYTWELVWSGVGLGMVALVVVVVFLIVRHKRTHQASLRVT